MPASQRCAPGIACAHDPTLTPLALPPPLLPRACATQRNTTPQQNALSPGQIALSITLLDKFGFAVDAIGQHIPPAAARSSGSSFSIGPVRVMHAG
jgi:hypothetical protein